MISAMQVHATMTPVAQTNDLVVGELTARIQQLEGELAAMKTKYEPTPKQSTHGALTAKLAEVEADTPSDTRSSAEPFKE